MSLEEEMPGREDLLEEGSLEEGSLEEESLGKSGNIYPDPANGGLFVSLCALTV